jgi:hypothetical protein
MTHMRNIDSVPDPRKNPIKKEAVNPEKFEKALKVEKNDATDKREQRNRSKKAEEAEDEIDDVGAAIPVPKGLFKEYMKEDESGATVLDVEGGKSAHLVADDISALQSAPEEGYIAESDGSKSNISVGSSQNAPPPPPAPEDSSEDYDTSSPEETLPPPPPEEANQPAPSFNTPQSEFTPVEPEQAQDLETDEPKATERTSEPQKTSSDEKKTTEAKKKKKKKKSTEVKKKKTAKTEVKKTVAGKDEVKKPVEATDIKDPKEAQKAKAPKAETEKTPATPKQATKGKLEAKESTSVKSGKSPEESMPLPTEGLGDKQDSKDKDHSSDQGTDDTTVGQTAAPASTTGIEALQLSPFANMPKDVFELFEKMVGLMTMQKDDGKSTVTITLNMKGSVFNKCQVVLEHFDTAPHAFNVQFLGNPEGVEKFAKNLQGLTSAIAESKLTFSINLLPPKLSKNYAGRIEGTDNDSEGDEKKDGEEKQE